MSNTYVLDNSVCIKSIADEEGSKTVEEIMYLKNSYKISLLMPELFSYEFCSTVSRKLNPVAARIALRKIISRQVTLVKMEPEIVRIATDLVAKYPGVTFYDAAYHAVAKYHHILLITADKKYYDKVKQEGNIAMLDKVKVRLD